jgi:small subunit ribosomal protein S17
MSHHHSHAERVTVHKEIQGVVVSDAMDKSIVVRIDRAKLHPRYRKVVRLSSKAHVHDEKNEAHVGDTVRFVSCRPMSKTKTWRLVGIVERAK